MAVYDRWHKTHPNLWTGDGPDPAPETRDRPCKCGRGRNRMYPTAAHGVGRRWQVRWYDDEGKQCKKNFDLKGGGRDETDPETYAEAYDAKVTADLNTDSYIDPEAGKLTLAEYAKQWRTSLVGDPSSLENIDKQLAHIYDVPRTERTKRAPGSSPIGHRQLRDLAKSPNAMRQWIKSLEAKKLSARYINAIGMTLSTILNAAVEDGRMIRNPMHAKSVKLPTAPDRLVRPWTLEMVEAARAEIDRRHASPAMVDLGAAAGLRESEVFAFAEEDIQFLGADRKILVRRQIKRIRDADGVYRLVFAPPKRGKDREVPLSDTLSQRLAEQIRRRPPVAVTLPWGRPDGKPRTYRLLFVRPGGEPWYRQAWGNVWNTARAAAGAPPPPEPDGRFHGLRHTFASIQLAGGADILKLASWLGHTDPGFTLRIYAHLMPDVRDVGRRAVDGWFTPSGDGTGALDVPSGGAP